ncbi:MAG TPA: hypothetical protein VMZ04_03575, partial [Anaerolineae bacterium]|nr:hypothetical protein [Anaerolineae bacterium]
YGTVRKNAVSFGGDVYIETDGVVKGDVVSIGGDVIVKDGGEVYKDIVSIGGSTIVASLGKVHGERISTHYYPVKYFLKHVFPFSIVNITSGILKILFFGPFITIFGTVGILIGFIFLMIKLLFSLAVASLVTYFFPENVTRMADYLREGFPKALLLGLMIMVVIPFLVLFLIITLIGIPLIPLVLVMLFFIYLFGSVGVALWIGCIIPESAGRSLIVNVLLGVLVVSVLKHLPIIGFFVCMVVFVTSFGVVLLSRSEMRMRVAAA